MEKEKPLISIILPCYNVEKYVGACLDSLMCQTYKNIEMLVVNDKSKDKTDEILTEYEQTDKRIKHFSNAENMGVSATRNVALDNAQGQFVAFVDSDDKVKPDFIEVLYNTMVNNDADMSVVSYQKTKDGENIHYKKYRPNQIEIFNQNDSFEEYFSCNKFDMCLWNKLYKRELIGNLRFDASLRYGEDVTFNYWYISKINKLAFNNNVEYYYFRRKTGLVKQKISLNKISSTKYLDVLISDSEKTKPQNITNYIHAWHLLVDLEMLYFSFKDKVYFKDYLKKFVNHNQMYTKLLKNCKKVPKYRRILLPLAFNLLNKKMKKILSEENE